MEVQLKNIVLTTSQKVPHLPIFGEHCTYNQQTSDNLQKLLYNILEYFKLIKKINECALIRCCRTIQYTK